jgi:type IV pilus assembly protein PilB
MNRRNVGKTLSKSHSPIRKSLITGGILTAEEVDQYSEKARSNGEPLWELLLRENKVTETWLADAFAVSLRLRLIGGPMEVDNEAAHRIPESLARKHLCIPISFQGSRLQVAFVDPYNLASIQAIEFFTGIHVQPMVGVRSQILQAIDEHYSRKQAMDVIDQAADLAEIQMMSTGEIIDLDGESSLKASAIPPIIKLVNMIMAEAMRAHASDVHLEPAEHEIHIRLRVDGVLREFLKAPSWMQAGLAARLKVLSKLDITERRVPQDGRFKVRYQSHVTDVRVSTLPTQFGEKVVMRVLGSSEGIPAPEKLGVPTAELGSMLTASKQPQGMIIVTGPTGSGKTTTLYSLLNYRRSPQVNIVTVEDPIEYQLRGAIQVQVNPKVGLSFAACLRSILRQDPDIILVGEVRDHETAEIAFHAAMTGHLVMTSLHTNDAVATVLRLRDLKINPFLITSSVTLIVAQRLVRVICDKCREPDRPSPRLLAQLGWNIPGFHFTRGRGCSACQGTGFRGRTGIYEILKMTAAVREAINHGASDDVIYSGAAQSGMVTLLEAARNKIREGKTTPEEVMRVIQWCEDETMARPEPPVSLAKPAARNLPYESKPHLACPSCGKMVEPTWRVCPQCVCLLTPTEGDLHSEVKKGRSGHSFTGEGPDSFH